jgi:hypothetical protein
MSGCLTRVDNSADKTGDHMSRLFAAATALFVAAGSWSVAAQQPATLNTPLGAKSVVPRVAGARNVLTIIQGTAVNSANSPLPGTLVRLRDARFGRVIATQRTNESGMFAFQVVDPGTYIVELLGQDQRALAASQILNVNAGDAVSAVVKLPRMTAVAGILNSSIAPLAAMLATQAAARGIAAVVPTAPISPNQ